MPKILYRDTSQSENFIYTSEIVKSKNGYQVFLECLKVVY